MTTNPVCIRYKKGYNYQLVDAIILVNMPKGCPDVHDRRLPFCSIQDSILGIVPGYAWDGASGAVDTSSFMVASCVHDVICQMTDLSLLPYRPWRKWGDEKLVEICRANGMSWIRSMWVLAAVRWFSKRNRTRRQGEPIFTAPAKGVDIRNPPSPAFPA